MKTCLLIMLSFVTSIACALTEEIDGITWRFNVSNNEVRLQGCSTPVSSGHLTIPGEIGGLPTRIESGAFSQRKDLINVTISNGVQTIEPSAFYECSNLTSVEISGSVTAIGKRAFYGCGSLTSIEIPGSVTTIEESAFSGCNNLTAVTFSEGLTSLGTQAFTGCENLTSVTLPTTLTTCIGSYSPFYRLGHPLLKLYVKGPVLPKVFFRDWDSSITIDKFYYSPQYEEEWRRFLFSIDAPAPREWICMESKVCVLPTTTAGGTVSFREKMVAWDDEVTVTAEAANGYRFLGWSSNHEGIEGTGGTLTFKIPSTDVILIANFFPDIDSKIDESINKKIDGEILMTKEQADNKIQEALNEKISSGDLLLKEQVDTKIQEVIDEKLEKKELVSADAIKEMAFGSPMIEVKDGKAVVGIELQKASQLTSGKWEKVKGEEASIAEDGSVHLKVLAEEKEAFYKFVVPTK